MENGIQSGDVVRFSAMGLGVAVRIDPKVGPSVTVFAGASAKIVHDSLIGEPVRIANPAGLPSSIRRKYGI